MAGAEARSPNAPRTGIGSGATFPAGAGTSGRGAPGRQAFDDLALDDLALNDLAWHRRRCRAVPAIRPGSLPSDNRL